MNKQHYVVLSDEGQVVAGIVGQREADLKALTRKAMAEHLSVPVNDVKITAIQELVDHDWRVVLTAQEYEQVVYLIPIELYSK